MHETLQPILKKKGKEKTQTLDRNCCVFSFCGTGKNITKKAEKVYQADFSARSLPPSHFGTSARRNSSPISPYGFRWFPLSLSLSLSVTLNLSLSLSLSLFFVLLIQDATESRIWLRCIGIRDHIKVRSSAARREDKKKRLLFQLEAGIVRHARLAVFLHTAEGKTVSRVSRKSPR